MKGQITMTKLSEIVKARENRASGSLSASMLLAALMANTGIFKTANGWASFLFPELSGKALKSKEKQIRGLFRDEFNLAKTGADFHPLIGSKPNALVGALILDNSGKAGAFGHVSGKLAIDFLKSQSIDTKGIIAE